MVLQGGRVSRQFHRWAEVAELCIIAKEVVSKEHPANPVREPASSKVVNVKQEVSLGLQRDLALKNMRAYHVEDTLEVFELLCKQAMRVAPLVVEDCVDDFYQADRFTLEIKMVGNVLLDLLRLIYQIVSPHKLVVEKV